LPPEGLEEVSNAFSQELNRDPNQGTVPARDDRGRFQSTSKPEHMFAERQVEGDPLTGDTSDGGEDARLRAREERVNGEPFDSQRRLSDRRESVRRPLSSSENEGHPRTTTEQGVDGEGESEQHDSDLEGIDPDAETEAEPTDAERDAERDAEAGPKYEVNVDGETREVSLREALDGYIRTETFHSRMNGVNSAAQTVDQEARRVAAMRDQYIQRTAQLEEEIGALLPKQPNWDEEFNRDPKAAHALQKQYEAVYGKIDEIRQNRARAVQEQQAEVSRGTEAYAKNEFARFVTDCKIPDEPALKKEIQAMRKTALAAGFSEQEVATVYDSRMLKILRKASKYDRIVAARPKPVIPGKGKTLSPGSAPRIGTASRKGIDDAQRRLANSGKIEDAAVVFGKLIR